MCSNELLSDLSLPCAATTFMKKAFYYEICSRKLEKGVQKLAFILICFKDIFADILMVYLFYLIGVVINLIFWNIIE